VVNKLNQLGKALQSRMTLFLSISIGVFLFMLFFQPFPISRFDFNNNLLFIAGFGAIVFIIMTLVFLAHCLIFPDSIDTHGESGKFTFFDGFILLALNSVAFTFYLHYVGSVLITFYTTFKICIICLAPPMIFGLNEAFLNLKLQNKLLLLDKKFAQTQLDKYEHENINKPIEFVSENTNENFILQISEVVFIKSADNYVEIAYKEGDTFKKRLIRNTLKNIEQQLSQYANFIRCHRVCIVNIHHVEHLNRANNNYWLKMEDYEEKIPVSRQYLLKIREYI
jgi:hypothetical protein